MGFLYPANAELISIRWSAAILAEAIEHLTANLPTFDAEILCTNNIKDFPAEAMKAVDIQALTADDLLSLLVTEYSDETRAVHQTVVSRLPGATDESSLATLRRAGAAQTANLMEDLLDG